MENHSRDYKQKIHERTQRLYVHERCERRSSVSREARVNPGRPRGKSLSLFILPIRSAPPGGKASLQFVYSRRQSSRIALSLYNLYIAHWGCALIGSVCPGNPNNLPNTLCIFLIKRKYIIIFERRELNSARRHVPVSNYISSSDKMSSSETVKKNRSFRKKNQRCNTKSWIPLCDCLRGCWTRPFTNSCRAIQAYSCTRCVFRISFLA